MTIDPLEYLRQKLASFAPDVQAQVAPLLAETRRIYGGDSVYIRTSDYKPPCRRTVQRRALRQTLDMSPNFSPRNRV
jgi:hypothetical protein